MHCCSTSAVEGTDRFFSKHAHRYLKRFRKRGLAKEQRYLLEGITASSIEGKSILEIGSGIGSLHLTLLQQRGDSAVGVDISEGMIETARTLSRDLGLEKRTSYFVGDFVQMNGSIPESDIVIMDKVVCCYADLDALLDHSMKKCREVYALSFPRPALLVKVAAHAVIFIAKLLKWSFRPYWHDWDRMIHQIEESGFRPTYHRETIAWRVMVFRR